ncbi:uncharacterized protein BX663DRAFT_307897 [Cokeromyces recurvatus]|uniref:uncharacterized protein n=1 Tax=Cokeromyces recurvatus TaxID=90255 RepID=UPI002220963C|nr:uncharacterized protein BX663DRAFT_307897 [Cokeromyces recurvatus]KAI7905015.1 hypothetical protein BX663DRAFT_307897 [Cokeromyces recurvatus]
MSSSNNSGNREHKRKRLTQACELCRRKKIKCDGGKPACNNCIRLKNICTYSSTNKKRGPRQGYIEILEQRLAKMEQILLSDSISSGNTLSDVKGLDQTSYKGNQVEEQKRYNETLPHISSSTTHFTSAEGYNNDNDTMNNYSESSNNARKNQKKRSNEDLYSETSPSSYSSFSHNFPSSNIHMLNQCSPLLQEDKTNQNNLFPSMSVIEHLVDIFFKYLFSITPIFDERKLRDDIRDQKCSDFLILCLLAACASVT